MSSFFSTNVHHPTQSVFGRIATLGLSCWYLASLDLYWFALATHLEQPAMPPILACLSFFTCMPPKTTTTNFSLPWFVKSLAWLAVAFIFGFVVILGWQAVFSGFFILPFCSRFALWWNLRIWRFWTANRRFARARAQFAPQMCDSQWFAKAWSANLTLHTLRHLILWLCTLYDTFWAETFSVELQCKHSVNEVVGPEEMCPFLCLQGCVFCHLSSHHHVASSRA